MLRPLREPGVPLRLWIGCSGGADSVALLGLLHTLRATDQLVLGVGHIDHVLRPDSSEDAAHVVQLGEALELPVTITQLTLAPGPGLPARARDARRAALAAGAGGFGAHAIALGHTATDRTETVLLNLTRGAALDGLAAMGAVDRDGLGVWTRPLLGLTREQTRDLCGRLALRWVEDPTNLDVAHPRVAIRREVLPRLRALREGVDLAIASSGEAVREARDAIASMVRNEIAVRGDPQGRLDVKGIGSLPRAVRTAMVRAVCMRAGLDADAVGRRTLADVDRALLDLGPRRRWDLQGGRRVVLDERYLWVEASPSADR